MEKDTCFTCSLFCLALFVSACADTGTLKPTAAEATCSSTAVKVVALMVEDEAKTKSFVDSAVSAAVTHCETDHWSVELMRCWSSAETRSQGKACALQTPHCVDLFGAMCLRGDKGPAPRKSGPLGEKPPGDSGATSRPGTGR